MIRIPTQSKTNASDFKATHVQVPSVGVPNRQPENNELTNEDQPTVDPVLQSSINSKKGFQDLLNPDDLETSKARGPTIPRNKIAKKVRFIDQEQKKPLCEVHLVESFKKYNMIPHDDSAHCCFIM